MGRPYVVFSFRYMCLLASIFEVVKKKSPPTLAHIAERFQTLLPILYFLMIQEANTDSAGLVLVVWILKIDSDNLILYGSLIFQALD